MHAHRERWISGELCDVADMDCGSLLPLSEGQPAGRRAF